MEEEDDFTWLVNTLTRLDERIGAVGPDDHGRRFELVVLRDEVRQMLRNSQPEALAKAREVWTERAANKGSHEQDTVLLEGLVKAMTSSVDSSG